MAVIVVSMSYLIILLHPMHYNLCKQRTPVAEGMKKESTMETDNYTISKYGAPLRREALSLHYNSKGGGPDWTLGALFSRQAPKGRN